MKKTPGITLPRLFMGEMTGGIEPKEWESLSMPAKLAARLSFIEVRAKTLASMPYDPANGLPANALAETKRLSDVASNALEALRANDLATAAWLALEAGRRLERIDTWLAVTKAVDLSAVILTPKSKGGRATAEIKKTAAQEKIDKVAVLWSELSSRPEGERANVIAARMQAKPDTVRKWIKKAGLR